MSQPLQRQFTTIGYVFVPGDIPVGKTLVAKTASGKTVPVQVNAKATHADGSLRHADLTLEKLPDMTDAEKITFSPGPAVAIDSGAKLSNLLKVNFDAHADLTLSDGVYSVSIKKALQEPIDSRKIKTWLTGPLVNEWVFNVPFRKASGEAHPHLSASVAVRVYTGLKSIRLDLSVENDWAFEPNPKGFTYDANIVIDGKNVYTKAGLKHTHHTR